MKKIVLILVLVLTSTVGIYAQRPQKGGKNSVNRNSNRTERLEKRVNYMTDVMVKTYALDEAQRVKLLALNKELIVANQASVRTFNRKNNQGRRGRQNSKQTDNRVVKNQLECNWAATPMLHKQYRIGKLNEEVQKYEVGLKSILTKKQYKEYVKNMKEQLDKMNK